MTVLPTDKAAPSRMSVQAAPLKSRVFATREGLVGGTTANGHVIVSRDHFVALPSRRGLSGNGSGTYSVKVCTASRCAFEPVWDVGPWNTKDDYWNPSATREMWKDLPQGKPEAQAAYQDGYNGGKDQFGRTGREPGRDRPRRRHLLGRAAADEQRLGRRDVPVDRRRRPRHGRRSRPAT